MNLSLYSYKCHIIRHVTILLCYGIRWIVTFQFHKGTIRTCFLLVRCLVHIEFQFHKGTIRTQECYRVEGADFRFQFHKGTIRTFGLLCSKSMFLWFQFHKGTIRTINFILSISEKKSYFNSIKVRLELGAAMGYENAGKYFNSIKVRLEPQCYICYLVDSKFQFHKGTIRTLFWCSL